jgi:hypothetical protein
MYEFYIQYLSHCQEETKKGIVLKIFTIHNSVLKIIKYFCTRLSIDDRHT